MPDSISAKKAILFSATEPNENRKKRFSDFVKEKYGKDVEFVWKKDKTIKKGFRLQVGSGVRPFGASKDFTLSLNKI